MTGVSQVQLSWELVLAPFCWLSREGAVRLAGATDVVPPLVPAVAGSSCVHATCGVLVVL